MSVNDPFSGCPNVKSYVDEIAAAIESLSRVIEASDEMSEKDSLGSRLTAQLHFFKAVGEANDRIGIPPSRQAILAPFAELFRESGSADFDISRWRAAATAVAYKAGERPAWSGTKDSRMEAAMEFVAAWENSGLAGGADTIRKSLQRLRQRIRGTYLCKLDLETMTIRVEDAEAVIFEALPGKAGRPPSGRVPKRF